MALTKTQERLLLELKEKANFVNADFDISMDFDLSVEHEGNKTLLIFRGFGGKEMKLTPNEFIKERTRLYRTYKPDSIHPQ